LFAVAAVRVIARLSTASSPGSRLS
jgi:hypothetical protein